ncbi:aggregation factor core protein MAFp3, isoform C [uncultured Tateyamaria sp.]|uniref:aggregation factor core protein MAFp3, isoform C n=1 Tax=uncultured Tateyamaria sp. TaxID=455651 RepID=UPI002615F257|nr:aggregation factor core protein MAFp3, isoform C [uncultured Tateyamaria sp.]
MRLPLLLACLCAATPALSASLTVTFRDGAPKDRFTVTYDGACAASATDLVIDLGTAPAGLIFDTTGAGAGVEVFQPLEWVTGSARTSAVTDGDSALTLSLDGLAPGEVLAFTIDIDDTTSTRQITVDGSEMVGATLRVAGMEGTFDATGTARVDLPTCTS